MCRWKSRLKKLTSFNSERGCGRHIENYRRHMGRHMDVTWKFTTLLACGARPSDPCRASWPLGRVRATRPGSWPAGPVRATPIESEARPSDPCHEGSWARPSESFRGVWILSTPSNSMLTMTTNTGGTQNSMLIVTTPREGRT